MSEPTAPQLTVHQGGKIDRRQTLLELALTLREEAAEAQRKLEVVLDELRPLYAPGKYEEGNAILQVSETLTLDKALAERLYPGDEYKELTYTASSLKAKLSGEQYRAIQKVGKTRVTLTRKDES